MKKVASFVAIVLAACLSAVAPAAALPHGHGPSIGITVDRHSLVSGQQFRVVATSSVPCDWTVVWNADRRIGRGVRRFVSTFVAPVVTARTRVPLQARCFYAPAPHAAPPAVVGGSTTEYLRVTVPPSRRFTIAITVDPAGAVVSPPHQGGPGNGGGTGGEPGLPGTGGPMRWMVLAGLGALLAGSVTARANRRRVPA